MMLKEVKVSKVHHNLINTARFGFELSITISCAHPNLSEPNRTEPNRVEASRAEQSRAEPSRVVESNKAKRNEKRQDRKLEEYLRGYEVCGCVHNLSDGALERNMKIPPGCVSWLLPNAMNSETTPGLSVVSHCMAADNQDQYKEMYAMNRLSVANLLSSPSPVMQVSSEWQNPIAERQFNTSSLVPQLFQYPWAINFWLQFQNAQLQPHLQYAALARSLVGENPLDLSNKTMNLLQKIGIFNVKNEDVGSNATEKLPEESKANILRRNYTMEDLTQAVDDIRQGKLGTRRASVVYGIPRSTLRNKIYKLEAEGAIPSKVRRGKIAARRAEAEQKRCNNATVAAATLLDAFGNHSDSSSPSPHASMCPSSPDSTNSSGEGAVETPDPETKLQNTQLDPKWLESIWQNLFKCQNNNVVGDASVPMVDAPHTPTPIVEKLQKPMGNSEEWKRSRPKRGQYRKYDKNALDEAVRSVRRGEMSVHRAGSFFGVPHSTLEYKVKERNLMRKKKDHTYCHDSSTSEDGNPIANSNNFETSDSPPHASAAISIPISLD
uniref:HTH psq-type domain-containing protein n=2 Tax=Caenorhabditis japonica TaxID=281687 RepID=A0A8R1HUY7_CAEJA